LQLQLFPENMDIPQFLKMAALCRNPGPESALA
jgi:hypothetical protein